MPNVVLYKEKSVLSNFQSQPLHKGKRNASISCENSHQKGSNDWDFGNLPESIKQIIYM